MSQFADWLLWELVRTTFWLALAGIVVLYILRLAHVASPTLHRVAWCAALVAGWSFVRVPLDVPWYPVEAPIATRHEHNAPDTEPRNTELSELPPPVPITFSAPPAAERIPWPTPEPPRWSLPSWPILVIATWIAGIVALVGTAVLGYLWFMLRLPKGVAAEVAWTQQWLQLQETARVAPIPMRVTDRVGPLLCRFPTGYELLVPEGLWRKLSPAERRAILLHELAHWRRGDLWKSLAVRGLALPHWFNPASWLAVRSFDEAAEWACDRAATEGEPAAYAKILMHVGELAAPRARFGTPLGGRPLAARIRRLVSLEQKEDRAMKKIVLVTAAIVLAAAALVRVQLVAQQPEALPMQKKSTKEESPTDKLRAAEREMVEQAKKAYETARASYAAGTVTFDYVPFWSDRWLAAELAVASTQKERVAAAQARLERMREMQQGIKKLYDAGSRGGEAFHMAAINYHVAEAERELEAQRTLVREAEGKGLVPRGAHSDTQAPSARSRRPQAVRFKGRTFDEWKDEFDNELDPQSRKLALEAFAEFAANGYGTRVAELVMHSMHSYSFWPIDLFTNGAPNSLAVAAYEAMKSVPPEELLPVLLRTLEGNVPPAAAAGAAPLAADQGGNKNQRLFAIALLPFATPERVDAVDLLLAQQTDASPQVRYAARVFAAVFGHDSPKMQEMLLATLKSSDREDVLSAIGIIGGLPFGLPTDVIELGGDSRPLFNLAPELIELLGSTDDKVSRTAEDALQRMSSEIYPVLKQAAQSENPEIAKRAKKLLAPYNPPIQVTPHPYAPLTPYAPPSPYPPAGSAPGRPAAPAESSPFVPRKG